MMTVGSLFSGIGGLELGLEWAGFGPVLWQVEIDEYCRRVLANRWPDATRFADVRACGAANLAPVDLLCGGFPCQGNSVAGRRLGLADPRSGLWREFARLIRELRPRYVAIENVPGALAPVEGGEAPLLEVLRDLAAAGFDAWWGTLSAADVGAPHLRKRVFVFAWRAMGDSDGARLEGQRSARRLREAREEVEALRARRDGVAGDGGRPLSGLGRDAHGISAFVERGWPAGRGEPSKPAEPPRRVEGAPRRRERLSALGNAVSPPVAFAFGLFIRRLLEEEAMT